MNSELLNRIELINNVDKSTLPTLPQLRRKFHLETRANLANIVIQQCDSDNSYPLPIEQMELWFTVVEGMLMYRNLGVLYMLVDSDGKICVVPSHFIKSDYRKGMYFHTLKKYKIAILKREHRAKWSELVNSEYANNVQLYPRICGVKQQ